MTGMNFGDRVAAYIERPNRNGNHLKIAGIFHVQQIRKGEIIRDFHAKNGIVNEGLNHALGVIFNNVANINPWYLALVDDDTTPAYDATDTLASNGFTEFVGYSEANRVDWAEDAASGQAITNSTAATFTINISSGNIDGIFVTSQIAKSNFTGTLWSTAPFASPLGVNNTDVIKITYTVSAI